MDEVARRTRNDSVPLEEDDPDTVRVAPRSARKRSRQDSGVHLDDKSKGIAVSQEDSSGKDSCDSATGPKHFWLSSGISPVIGKCNHFVLAFQHQI
jgi:hypothetical protein